ncbi:MAG: phospho-N-acetylmuramoyl-pentapeptide-transferase [Bacteroidota bacterium]|nr:phospho-N-acetylmuramoyl-pentapeptide-transferase [Bacteroidota bacterium]MEC7526521.1 phospho-N-acetylmuramoyl-pentapeptide-transferase [Bacteroidota bacterium]MEC7813592.1 phospho-N-acetylmuramoyl-pentapeptide-transferase [Bacteroidota bacterium]MEC7945363.1 phospho-N-acetylmuramoyl-pentapeptide-transferase [Bacteroidota bacterium]MEC7954315.1 phospho-N-acetylmuramoyl-pentapeptide-transferase [Bacteroidota bacterium]|tara:strand:- start:3776 stop:5005 length:1230 start_codon:yes stop_codon:yes gene_type:complete
MLYHLFTYLNNRFDFPGSGLFEFISFKAALAVITSLVITLVFGGRLIRFLHQKQVGETVRDLGLDGQLEKTGTPTMGGIIILAGILVPTLLFADLSNIYIQLMLISTVLLGAIGFVDDYIKVFKKNKEGLAGKFKVFGQIAVGLIVASSLYFHQDVTIKSKVNELSVQQLEADSEVGPSWVEMRSTKTTIPFVKNNEFDYSWLLVWLNKDLEKYTWIIFIPLVIIIVTAVSNGANITDGLDGLATGTSAIIGTTLAIFAYLSGNLVFADYLNILFIPNSSELVIFISSFVGACIGFLWYNSYPAKVFMGDTGSLALGGIIAVFAIAIRKELLIPVFCGVFLIENLSVILQVSYFKYTKKKYGEGRRIFLMSPIHHHYQKKGVHEAKIVARFWILGILLAVLSIVTLKIR